MNYLKVYCNLIRKAENRTPPEGYTEKHHTFPVSIFGKNNRVVMLTAREHYISHALLEKICIQRYGLRHWKTKKMNRAHIFMKGEFFNSYLYESAKGRKSILMKGEGNHFWGRNHSNQAKKKIGEKSKGRKHSDIAKQKISDAGKGRNHSEKTREQIKNKLMGHFVSESTREKMREKSKGRKHSNEVKDKISKCQRKLYKFVSPNGEVVEEFTTLKDFALKYNLRSNCLCMIVKGYRKSHKGWTIPPSYDKL